MSKSRILKEVHNTAKGLHKAKAISTITMRNYDKMCLAPVHELDPSAIKGLREREKVSQEVFAAYLNTNVSTIQKWELGKKKPSGIALKLLNLVDTKGLDSII